LPQTSRAGAALGDALYLLDDRGLNQVRESDGDASAEPEIESFLAYPAGFVPQDAASDTRSLLAVGTSGDAPSLLRFDAASLVISPLALPVDAEASGARFAIAALEPGRFAVAVVAGSRLHVGFLAAGAAGGDVEWSHASDVAASGAPALAANDGLLTVFAAAAEDGDAAGVAAIEFDLRHPGNPPRTSRLAAAAGETVIGAVPPAGSGAPRAAAWLAGGDHGVRLLDARGNEIEPALLAAWSARRFRLDLPLLVHLGALALLGITLRRRTPGEPRVVVYRPAALWRRIVAFLGDAGIAAVVAIGLFAVSRSAPELAYAFEALPRESAATAEDGFGAPRQRLLLLQLADLQLAFLLCLTLLAVLQEAIFGRSIGKSLMGIRVMGLDGASPSLGAAATRAVMLIIDVGVWNGVIGVFMIVFTRRKQRLGDLFGGTVVVHEQVSTRTLDGAVGSGGKAGAEQAELGEPRGDRPRE
jgi:uncharacterized RDD family membrane protein YckC